MRLVTHDSKRGARAGALTPVGVVDAWDALGRPDGEPEGSSPNGTSPTGVRALLAADLLGELADAVEAADAGIADATLLAPVPDPEKLICIGLNYADHAAEAGIEPPSAPTFFAKFANALVPHDSTVSLPASSQKVDYEAEIAFVVGRTAKHVPVASALDHVAGYTLLNDLSARDLQMATPQWMPGKIFDGSAPCGPALVTADEVGDPTAIPIALDLNGERMQGSSSAQLIFGVAELLAHLSTLTTLLPGDIVSTGTPAGVGSSRQPHVWLQDGDVTVVSSPALGELRTSFAR